MFIALAAIIAILWIVALRIVIDSLRPQHLSIDAILATPEQITVTRPAGFDDARTSGLTARRTLQHAA